MTEAVLAEEGRDAVQLMSSSIDAMKLKSSMTLFDAVSPDDIFDKVLCKYYDGQRCNRTLRMMIRGQEHLHPW